MSTTDKPIKNGSERDLKGRFAPGNKIASQKESVQGLRRYIRKFLNDKIEDLPEIYENADNTQKMKILTDLFPYAMGKIESVKGEEESSEPKKIEIIVKDGDLNLISEEFNRIQSEQASSERGE